MLRLLLLGYCTTLILSVGATGSVSATEPKRRVSVLNLTGHPVRDTIELEESTTVRDVLELVNCFYEARGYLDVIVGKLTEAPHGKETLDLEKNVFEVAPDDGSILELALVRVPPLEILERLKDEDFERRRSAFNALVKAREYHVEVGDKQTLSGIRGMLNDRNEYVRRAVLKALSQLAEKGDQSTLSPIRELLNDRNEYVRRAAVEALSQLAEKGDQSTLRAIRKLLNDVSEDVRRSAVEALSQLGEKGSRTCLPRRFLMCQ